MRTRLSHPEPISPKKADKDTTGKINGVTGDEEDEMMEEEKETERLFGPETDEEEEEQEEWQDIGEGGVAPTTPRMSPNAKEEDESKGLSQKDIGKKESKEDEKMWDDMFMNGENYDAKNGWKKWKDQFGDEEAEEGLKPRVAQRIPKVSK